MREARVVPFMLSSSAGALGTENFSIGANQSGADARAFVFLEFVAGEDGGAGAPGGDAGFFFCQQIAAEARDFRLRLAN